MVAADAARRGQRLYDRWAEYGLLYRAVDRLSRPVREVAVAALDPDPGDAIVDLGCGPGGSFGLLSEAVGPAGDVLGGGYSGERGRAAAGRAAERPPVSVLRGDAAALPLRTDAVDGAFASLALSAMSDLERVLDEVERVVRSGGRLAVVDGRVPDGAFGSALRTAYRRLVNFRHSDVVADLRRRFASVTVVDAFDAGLGFVARVEIE
jgi:ubiquinone/menaquinone biosynthesis C-methylase UbiE